MTIKGHKVEGTKAPMIPFDTNLIVLMAQNSREKHPHKSVETIKDMWHCHFSVNKGLLDRRTPNTPQDTQRRYNGQWNKTRDPRLLGTKVNFPRFSPFSAVKDMTVAQRDDGAD